MILRMEQIGCDTVFDRFDKQQPQCTFGIAGVCCRVCFMGPVKLHLRALVVSAVLMLTLS